MKKISVFLALMAMFFGHLALAANQGVATSVTGSVQVQTPPGGPHPLRQGDEVTQGDTIITGASSAVVIKFDDGQVAALTANSRMTITAYQYNPATEGGNVLLSLVSGGMRAITGLIGRRAPSQVAYRAATATIGIRGTDTTIATADGNVVVTVSEGSISFSFGGQTLTVAAGEAVLARPGQPIVRGTIASVVSQLPTAIRQAVEGVIAMNSAVLAANPGQARQGQQGQQGQQGEQGQSGQVGQQGGPQGGGSGGGTASGS